MTPTKSQQSVYAQWLESCRQADIPAISTDTAATLHPRATYMATTNETCGFAYVIREATIDGHNFTTLIKVFTDEDPDFNLREAEDLAKHLNEK